MTPLLERRAQQGHKTALIDVEDLDDEFTFGQKSPWAIKAFLVNAQATWASPPRFVVLVGNASADPRSYLRHSAADSTLDYVPDADFVPTKMVSTRALKTASDDWFVDADEDGIPELAAIGRLSVLTAGQASAVAAKLLAYERTPPTSWTKNVLFVADAKDPDQPDFEALSLSAPAEPPRQLCRDRSLCRSDRRDQKRRRGYCCQDCRGPGRRQLHRPRIGGCVGKSADLLTPTDVNAGTTRGCRLSWP